MKKIRRGENGKNAASFKSLGKALKKYAKRTNEWRQACEFKGGEKKNVRD